MTWETLIPASVVFFDDAVAKAFPHRTQEVAGSSPASSTLGRPCNARVLDRVRD